ncbi:MAG TPA: phosphatase PAP2 family protein [Acidimicrobiales bacterium]|nr:phosphatase PAP2 family protein [Acidimicrobiales bacterium]
MATGRSPHRHVADLAVLAAGLFLLALSALLLDGQVPEPELAVFRAVNRVRGIPFAMAWAPMQLGNVMAVPAAVLAALVTRRYRAGLALGAAGLSAWVVGKVVKGLVERGRPGALVEAVVLRDAPVGGLGFVSGHAAVAVALATTAWPYLGRWGRAAAAALAVLVCLLRLYVGAHLPLDVVGGAGLGLVAGAAVHLVVGRPGRAVAP